MTELFDVEAVSHRYPGNPRPALSGVSLGLTAGRHLGVIGESGSGKTTLSRIMLGLIAPSDGAVLYRGEPVPTGRGRRCRDFRRRVQLVLQDPFTSLDPRMPVGRIVAEPIRALRPELDATARVHELLAAVELPAEIATRLPRQLSGGQRQRVAIARALGPRPEVVIADEPVSALDVSVREQVLQLLRRLCAHEDLTLLVISHDLGIVGRLCAETVVMTEGRIVERGPTATVLNAPEHPYTRELVDSIPRLPAAGASSAACAPAAAP